MPNSNSYLPEKFWHKISTWIALSNISSLSAHLLSTHHLHCARHKNRIVNPDGFKARKWEIFSPGHAFLSANLGHSVSPWSSAASASDSNIQSARLELWSITRARALGEVDLWLKWTKLLESYIYFCFLPHHGHGRLTNSKSAKSVYFLFLSIFACFFLSFLDYFMRRLPYMP